jgi:hypothetical protein
MAESVNKVLSNIGLFFFFVITVLVGIVYVDLLWDKITRPSFKNLDAEWFVWLGFLMAMFIIADYFILRRFYKGLIKKRRVIVEKI